MKLPRLLGFLAAFSIPGLAYAANTITLNCTGTLWSKDTDFKDKPIPPTSLFIDGKTVTGGFGDFSVTGVTNTHVMFQAPPRREGESPTQGQLDRISGSASVYSLYPNGGGMVWAHELTCKPANPLF
jgi:hypothetical protein